MKKEIEVGSVNGNQSNGLTGEMVRVNIIPALSILMFIALFTGFQE